jgi:hypothetical protein
MRLAEHADFEQAVLRAADHFQARGLRASIIEKDYYVTEALRIIAGTYENQVIFKGGTSLSKGWNLIQRFSEDIDIFLDPGAFQPPLGKNGINRELKRLRDAVAAHPSLTLLAEQSSTVGGFGRNDYFSYPQRFGGVGAMVNRVFVEAGTASGREPVVALPLRSLLAQFMQETGASLGAEDEAPFSMRLLHFRRTFVEKLFAIHGKVQLLVRDGQPLGTYARHYYDLFQLSGQDEVLAMLRSEEYATIKTDYDRISQEHFAKRYFPPTAMSFAESEALFPSADLGPVISKEYEEQCQLLCYAPHPSWEAVQDRFRELKELL